MYFAIVNSAIMWYRIKLPMIDEFVNVTCSAHIKTREKECDFDCGGSGCFYIYEAGFYGSDREFCHYVSNSSRG